MSSGSMELGVASDAATPVRVADYIAAAATATGSKAFFMLSGGMMMHLMDAFGRSPLTCVCNHHEQASAMAADAYARKSGKLGICLATSGPGATNLITGMAGAYQDSVPILFLTGQNKKRETIRGSGIRGLRQFGIFEVDIIPIVESITKYAAFLGDPKDVRYHVEKAIHLALDGRPGPVLLDVPLDIQGALVDVEQQRSYQPEGRVSPAVESGDMQRLIELITSAARPLLIGGHGIRAAGMEVVFRQLADTIPVPVLTSMMAKDLLPADHPTHVGQLGLRGNRGANFAVQTADLIIMMGFSLHIQSIGYEGELFAPNAYKVQIEIDDAVLRRAHAPCQWKLQWDLRDYLPVLSTRLEKVSFSMESTWPRRAKSLAEQFCSKNETSDLGSEDSPLNLYEFVHLLSEILNGNEVILTDAGQPFYILPQALTLKTGQRFLTPGSLAEMGWALPAAIGAAVADPASPVIAIVGDGSIMPNIQELETISSHGLNIKIFVINNDGYASIRNTQKTFFGGFYVGSTPESGVTLPKVASVADCFRIPYVNCPSRRHARESIAATLSRTGPVVCEVMSRYDQKVLPVVPSYRTEKGELRSKALHEMIPEVEFDFKSFVQGS
jgi:acetolactate synthase-1/2/3 large subunit